MPEYLAPGVYVEETSYRAKTISGVSTTTAGFIGPARVGPVASHQLVTSLTDFERFFGDGAALTIGNEASVNYLWHAARAFFEEGGKRLVIARLFQPTDSTDPFCGHAFADIAPITLRARYPGTGGNARVTLILSLGTGSNPTSPDIVWNAAAQRFEQRAAGSPAGSSPSVLAEVTITRGAVTDGAASLSLDPAHPRSLFAVLAQKVAAADAALPIILTVAAGKTGLDVLNALFAANPALKSALANAASNRAARSLSIDLTGGNDGLPLDLATYDDGLKRLEAAEDVSAVAAPGSTAQDGPLAKDVAQALITHADKVGFRLAIIDSVRGHELTQARNFRATFDSSYGAFYYPWIKVIDPAPAAAGASLLLPPSGFVAGIFARNDVERSVAKAPANEVVRLAIGFELLINKGQQDVLNPEGINCFRFFEGRGNRLYGGRTMSSDPEWKYVNVRRYFSYLEKSISVGLEWCVFEPNDEALWTRARAVTETFLFAEWRAGNLLGLKATEAFFVMCDRTTMTQADIDAGHLICLIGVAPIKPAEFILFRVGQKTASAVS